MGAPSVLVTILVCLATIDPLAGGGRRLQATGGIRGEVRDDNGGAVPGATVSAVGLVRRMAVADEQGRFQFLALPPGRYELAAELSGFNRAVRLVDVVAGSTARITLAMTVGSLTETITVTGAAPGLDASTSQAGGRESRLGTERYAHVEDNRFHRAGADPRSTFSIDGDTAGYANLRRFINDGALPPADAVRIEELVNYFRYDYPAPAGDAPFSVTTELAACPWNPRHQLARIGLKGRTFPPTAAPPRNLVFLIDVSGSMASPDKLPLVQQSLRMLAADLTANDRVAIVVYAGAGGLVLPSTPGDRAVEIGQALARLEAGGSTNGAAGILLAYRTAGASFIAGGVNRVILATDGDFNVGMTSHEALLRLIEQERESGVFLSVLAVGTGNIKDDTMELLADRGNGNYSYIDSLQEARKVLIEEAGGTLVTIAKDVKIQVEFNPATVAGYRLIGYENRRLEHEDFNDDRKDAGEIGAGHTVTALYEIVPAGGQVPASVDALKYRQPSRVAAGSPADELFTVKLRYKAPDGGRSRLLSMVQSRQVRPMSAPMGFAAAVAEAGLVLRGSPEPGDASLETAARRAREYRGEDAGLSRRVHPPDGGGPDVVTLVGALNPTA
jgi:Ca-activated chloride channel family protein